MTRGTRRAATVAFALICVILLLLGGAIVVVSLGLEAGPSLLKAAAGLAIVVAGPLLWYVLALLKWHFADLERLRGAMVTLAGDSSAGLPILEDAETGPEIRQLQKALGQLCARQAEVRALPDQRLQAVLASITEAMVVITDQGQVSLVNHAAKALLGEDRVACGTSVYAALSRTTVLDALARARAAGRPVDAMIGTLEDHQLTAKVAGLGEHGGAVLTFPAGEVAFRAELDVDLALHDQPPPVTPVTDDSPLEALPIVVLDTETTGLDVTRDRVVAIGAVRLVGGQIYRSTSFDRLVNPGQAIPPRSIAVHGITDAMVEKVPCFATVFERLQPLLGGTVMVGHQIAFDLHMLRRECGLAEVAWSEPPWLDTLLLAAALEPDSPDLSLDALADRLGVEVHGRHTALGDSLATAEIFARLLPRLRDRDVTTLGEARAFSRRPTAILRAQEKAGW